jgi:hypothetical protein
MVFEGAGSLFAFGVPDFDQTHLGILQVLSSSGFQGMAAVLFVDQHEPPDLSGGSGHG